MLASIDSFNHDIAVQNAKTDRLIIAITGASGVIYGIRVLIHLKQLHYIETHLVITAAARRTIREETSWQIADIKALADHCHHHADLGAAIASGSFRTLGMLVAPCSVKTLSSIAQCNDDNLVARAADVCLKERRRVVLMLRETPLHAGHIALMGLATSSGAIVMPPVPAFYHRPETIEEIVDHSVGRALDLFGIDIGVVRLWGE